MDNINNIKTVESEISFNELSPIGKTESYVLLNIEHFDDDSDLDNLNNDFRTPKKLQANKQNLQKYLYLYT